LLRRNRQRSVRYGLIAGSCLGIKSDKVSEDHF